jgi:hypothetical protein
MYSSWGRRPVQAREVIPARAAKIKSEKKSIVPYTSMWMTGR